MGGPVHSVSALAEHLTSQGCQVEVFTTNANLDQDLDVPTGQPEMIGGVRVTYFARTEFLKTMFRPIPYLAKSSGFVFAPGMLQALLGGIRNADVVHTHLPFVYPTWAAARVAKRLSVPLVYSQRGVLDPERLKFRSAKKFAYLWAVELPILRRASMLLALTSAETGSYRKLGLSNPCKVIPNGVDIGPFESPHDSRFIAKLGIQPSDTVVLFLSRLHPIKGADRVLEAFVRVHSKFPSARLVLAGPDEFDIERAFRARTEALGLKNRVTFPGLVTGSDKVALLNRADLFVLPSHAEGFSMAVLEAMAASTAVLISPGCNFPDVVAAGAGIICENDVDTLCANFATLLGDRERLNRLGRAGRRLVAERYSWGRIAAEMIDTYEHVIRSR